MGRKPTDKEQEEFLAYLRSGRDEMNLLEHSISSASRKVDRETRSLLFSRDDTDPDTRQPIKRTWEVSFSKYGRPSAIDDDVFVALLKISSELGFDEKRVEFTRYEICKILGWSDCGQSYKAIDDALRRITGVYIVATNFWYDNQAKGWRDRNFHVIDTSEVFTRERFDQERKRAAGGQTPKSWFQWSDTMMESFAAGYVRKLDIQEYLSLDNPVARKLYRYLGKHFWYKTSHAIDLGVLCWEKLGYSRSVAKNTFLRRKIEPAIGELEEKGYYGLSHKFNASYGKCEVVFKATAKTSEKPKKKQSTHPLVDRLVSLGIDRSDAHTAVERLTAERIMEDIEHVEFEAKAGRVKSSQAGMLARMLKEVEPWGRPQGFVSSAERAIRSQALAAKDNAERKRKEEEAAKREKLEAAEKAAFQKFLASLGSEAKRKEFQAESLRSETFHRAKYQKAVTDGAETLASMYLELAMMSHWKKGYRESTGDGGVQKSIRF